MLKKNNGNDLVDLKQKVLLNKKRKNALDLYSKKQKDIDGFFNDNENVNFKIDRPRNHKYSSVFFAVFCFFVLCVGYFVFLKNDDIGSQDLDSVDVWYSVKLLDGNVYYGKVNDIEADPVEIKDVYYDYDQLKNLENNKEQENNEIKKTGSIRLVKRGKETHGPSGSMSIVRSQILYFEPLAKDSKVLKAIKEHEDK